MMWDTHSAAQRSLLPAGTPGRSGCCHAEPVRLKAAAPARVLWSGPNFLASTGSCAPLWLILRTLPEPLPIADKKNSFGPVPPAFLRPTVRRRTPDRSAISAMTLHLLPDGELPETSGPLRVPGDRLP